MLRVSLERAIDIMLSAVSRLAYEQVGILAANGRISDEDIAAAIDLPPFDRSPLDGYAVKACDTNSASAESPVRLKVIDEVYAGGFSEKLIKTGEAVRIMTGAAIPKGSDCIVAQENTNYGEETVEIYKPHTSYQNYCFKGEDIKKNTIIVKKGEKLNYARQGLIASLGIPEVKVIKKPRVAILFTGDELTQAGMPLTHGKIFNSNMYLLAPRLVELGIQPQYIGCLPDRIKDLSDSIIEASKNADLIITTGGVSVGKKDILRETMDYLNAEILYKGLDFKPGSPAIFSLYKGIPILSLSGNPFAAATTFELLARPILLKMTGDSVFDLPAVKGVSGGCFNKKSPTRRFIRGNYQNGSVFIPHSNSADVHSSMVIGSMFDCNCLVDIKPGSSGLNYGDEIEVLLLDYRAASK